MRPKNTHDAVGRGRDHSPVGEATCPVDGAAAEVPDRARFDSFLSDLLGCILGLPVDRMDPELERALGGVCGLFDLDRCSLWQFLEWEPETLRLTHLFQRTADSRQPSDAEPGDRAGHARVGLSGEAPLRTDMTASFPWLWRRLMSAEATVADRVEDLPDEAARDRETFLAWGTRSMAILPLAAGGAVLGGMAFVSERAHRSWSAELVERFRLIAHVFAVALARQRTGGELGDMEARLRLAADSARIGTWMLDPASGRFWASDRARALFGYAAQLEITMASFLESVHPEDRERVREAVQRAVEEAGEVDVEYRVQRSDAAVSWVHSRGRAQAGRAGRAPYLLGVTMDVTERRLADEAQAEQLRFETLLSDLSAEFVNLPADQVDAAIIDAQRRVCECLGFELSALWQWAPDDQGSHTLTHLHRPPGGPPVPDRMEVREHFPWCLDQLLTGKVVGVSALDELPPEAARDKEVWQHYGVKTSLAFPLRAGGGSSVGFLSFNTMETERPWPETLVQRLRLVAEVFANALERKRAEERLRASFAEVSTLRAKLELENRYLTQEYRLRQGHGRIVGESPAILGVLSLVEQVAPSRSTVLIEGETGTGKELVAQRIHELSPRHGRPMVKVNCAALPSNLVESELFGREKGAFTGAVSREPGRFEVANGSTIFLDEVAELPLELQAKLLRVLEEGRFERVGSSRTLSTDVRVIAATNRDLRAEVEAGRFRRDLFYRLAVFPIRVPPLCDRREDVPLLVWSAVEELSGAMHKAIESIPRKDMERLRGYDWPGNVRELRNVVERAMILCSGATLRIDPPSAAMALGEGADGADMSLDEAQRQQIAKALEASSGRISGPGGAAERLGLKPTTLRSKMKRLRLEPRRPRNDRQSS